MPIFTMFGRINSGKMTVSAQNKQLDKPYFEQTMWELYRSRAPWLLFLMISATFSGMVIRNYENALAALTALTAYIPMLTDTGGNAGSQSTSTIIRSMAMGEVAHRDVPRLLWREQCGGPLWGNTGGMQLFQDDLL